MGSRKETDWQGCNHPSGGFFMENYCTGGDQIKPGKDVCQDWGTRFSLKPHKFFGLWGPKKDRCGRRWKRRKVLLAQFGSGERGTVRGAKGRSKGGWTAGKRPTSIGDRPAIRFRDGTRAEKKEEK